MDTEPKEVKVEDTSEVYTLKPPITCSKGGHTFTLKGMDMGMQMAECTNCPVGYLVPLGGEIKNGHVYIHGTLVV